MTSTTRGLSAVLTAQFLSAFADNALLFAAIALLGENNAPAWHTPLLQAFFLIAYIALAPFVGHLADAFPKGRVMLFSNGLKLAGAGSMFLGVNPLVAYSLVGVGAAAYSPAKYGILGELVPPEKLVKANGLLESSNSVAILMGVVAGGYLADRGAQMAVGVTVAFYALAGLVNLSIPALEAATSKLRSPRAQLRDFFGATVTLINDPDARISLIGTSVVIGTGSTLRFLLVAWVPVSLGILGTAVPAALSGAVAIGIALGAVAAGRFVTITSANRALPAGLAVGALTIALGQVSNLLLAAGILVAIGVCGGFYIVPLKAVLQDHGKASVGAGSAISVQSIFNNISMLVMAGAYTAMTHAGTPPAGMALAVGVFVLLVVGLTARVRTPARHTA